MKSEFGVIGLGVMGKSISRNLADKGFWLSLYNQRIEGVEENVAQSLILEHSELKTAQGFEDLKAFVQSLELPRKIFLMVKAGEVVDQVIQEVSPFLTKGDIIIDGGNSHFKDTERREKELSALGMYFIGVGVSGGEEGALRGPSIMPGGLKKAYSIIAPYLEAISAVGYENSQCCAFVGQGGSGHFVKMVHNGIEYAEMQLIAEIYSILKNGAGYSNDQISQLLISWNNTDVNSYLLEITIDILQKKNKEGYLFDQILDKAGNKGTGGWTTNAACELGVPIPTLTAALFARYQSSYKSERGKASKLYKSNYGSIEVSEEDLFSAYKVSRIINHHQGFHLIAEASTTYGWNINLAELARIWTNGCIIRSELMVRLIEISASDGPILQYPDIVKLVSQLQNSFGKVVSEAIKAQIPIPCISASLNYLSAYVEENSSANMIQAQRDYFGAHTYQRKDNPNGPFYHTNWTEE